ncbi:hypothetical protein HispidOSU_017478, partial [Sigmodon hispidus]
PDSTWFWKNKQETPRPQKEYQLLDFPHFADKAMRAAVCPSSVKETSASNPQIPRVITA